MRLHLLLPLGLAACPGPEDTAAPEVLACEPYALEDGGSWTATDLGAEDPVGETGAAVALGDLDGDGWLDAVLAFSSGRSLALRNDGSGRLVEDGAFTLDGGAFPVGTAVAVGDVDGDGDLDVFFGRPPGERNLLLHNDGSGRFASVELPDPERSERTGTWGGGTFGDLDGDGDLDLFLARYVERIDPDAIRAGTSTGSGNTVYRNEGGTFLPDEEALPAEVIDDITFHGQVLDADRDGDLDLYLSNDFGLYAGRNRLLLNDGSGRFTTDDDCFCDLKSFTMGAGVGDADGDGWPDLYVTDIGGPTLLLNAGDGSFVDATFARSAEIPPAEDRLGSWGSAFVDLDGDGWEDLAVVFGKIAVGHPDDALSSFDESVAGFVDAVKQRDAVLLADGGTAFVDASAEVGFEDDGIGRSVAVGDLDRDGRPDLVTASLFGARVFHGRGGCPTAITLQPAAGPTPIGLEVEAVVGDRTLIRRLLPSTTFSSSAPELLLGLGGHSAVSDLTVRWPDGGERTWSSLDSGSVLVLEPESR